MLMNGINHIIKVKYILDKNMYGFKSGQIYDAIQVEPLQGVEMVCIANMDGDGEEYAYPAKWFEVVEENI